MSDTSPVRAEASILIVDDTPANLQVLADMLKQQGYKARPVPSGKLALQAAAKDPPDLILLDITMPEMNGYQVCEQLKAAESTRDIPVLFISALGETEDKVKAFTVGGVDYITKPFQLEEVLARVETHLALRNLQRELGRANRELEKRVAERTAELLRLNTAMERFVPREFLSFLQKSSIAEVRLGDQVQRDMTVMFADLRGFTSLSECLTPQENFDFLNAYLGQVSPVIRRHRGFIDKYVGDAVMALFPEAAEDALQAAIAIRGEVAGFNAWREGEAGPPIAVGIGLHAGSLMLGILGEAERLQGSVISDAVNLAARLEGVSMLYGVAITVSEQTLQRLPDSGKYHFRCLGWVQVKGKQQPVSVFEVFDGDPAGMMERKLRTKPDFEEGLYLYQSRKFAEASVKFNQVVEQMPDDRASRLYLERAAHFLVHGVPPDWAGVEALREK